MSIPRSASLGRKIKKTVRDLTPDTPRLGVINWDKRPSGGNDFDLTRRPTKPKKNAKTGGKPNNIFDLTDEATPTAQVTSVSSANVQKKTYIEANCDARWIYRG